MDTQPRFTTLLRERFYLLGQSFPGYEQVLTQALFALVTKEHMLWYSKPGRAKSMVAKAIFDLFEGSSLFMKQLTKDTLPDAIFGNVIPDKLMAEGLELYNLDGGLAAVEFAYLDEFFDASDFVLRAMLNVLNERVFLSKDQPPVLAPLHSVIATTNYLRQREATEAVLDRLLCKAVVGDITAVTDLMRAGMTYLGYPGKSHGLPQLPYGELLALADFVELPEDKGGITITPGMRLLHVLLVKEFQQRRITAALKRWEADPANQNAVDKPAAEELGIPEITPRTLVKLHDFSRAAAALNNNSTVSTDDQRTLIYGLSVIGDDSGDELLWAATCDELLRLSSGQLSSLESLGAIADTVGQLKAEQDQTSSLELEIGGRMVVATEASLRELLDRVTGRAHGVLRLAHDALSADIKALGTARASGFKLIAG
ncbi:MAG TPA: MoxR family ATPase [Candidatus Saccharimonadales bacterium]|nr:MoxR family ATPase [Candidatus Saccharimonadales bacterium]